MKFLKVLSLVMALVLGSGGFAGSQEGSSQAKKSVVFFGDSLTSGYGVSSAESFPSLIQKEIDALGWPYRVVNAGLSGDTTAAGVSRLRWVLRQKAEVLILELGGNDGLRGIPVKTTRQNLETIIETAKKMQPDMQVILANMKMPPNYGIEYTKPFNAIYPNLAQKYNLVTVPYLLEGVGGKPELNLPDRIHPTAEGHVVVAANVWKILKPILAEKLKQPRK